MNVCIVHAKIEELCSRNIMPTTDILASELGTNRDIVNEYIMALQILELVELTPADTILPTRSGSYLHLLS